MDRWCWLLFVMVVAPICESWRTSSEEERKHDQESRRVHYLSKRHMLPSDPDAKKRPAAAARIRDTRKKPSGHLTPLKEDDMDNDEVVSVAIGPPPMRLNYDKLNWRPRAKNVTIQGQPPTAPTTAGATSLVKDVLTQIGREFLSHQMNEDFVFGQYVGQAMKNITSDQKLQFQHDILELVIKYQKLSRGEPTANTEDRKDPFTMMKDVKDSPKLKALMSNETDENWPDFTNLAKLVG